MAYTEVLVTWEGKRGDVYEGFAGVEYTWEPDGDEYGAMITEVYLPENAPNTPEMMNATRAAFYTNLNETLWGKS